MDTINMLFMLVFAIIIAVVLYKYIISRQRLPYDKKINMELMFKAAIINFSLSMLLVLVRSIYYEINGNQLSEALYLMILGPFVILLVLLMNGILHNKVIRTKHYINKYDIVIYALTMAIGIGISNLVLLGLFRDGISSILVVTSAVLIPLTYMMTMAYFLVKHIEGKKFMWLLAIIFPCAIVFQEDAFTVYGSILGIIGYFGFEILMYLLFTVLFTKAVRSNAKFDFIDVDKQLYRFSNEKTLQERLSYRFDKFMAYGNAAITGLLILIGVIVVLIVSLILFIETPEITEGSFLKMIWLSFMRVLDPGNVATDTEFNNIKFVIITTIATFIGLGIIATYIGMVSGEFGARIEKLREGNSKILEKDHILFIGFCEDTLKILDNLVKLYIGKDKLNIVILSRKPRKELEEVILSYGLHNMRNKLTCRSGDLYSMKVLHNVGISHASKVIIIGDKKDESFRIAMSVHNILKEDNYKNVDVSLMSDTGYDLTLSKETFGDTMTIYSRSQLEFDPLFRALTLKEYMKLYGSLMGADGNLLIYLDAVKKTVGKTFGHIAAGFSYSTVIGIEKNDDVLLNPPKELVVQKEDRLIFLTDANTQPDFIGVNKKFKMTSDAPLNFVSEQVKEVLIIGNCHANSFMNVLTKHQGVHETTLIFEENEGFYSELNAIMTKKQPEMVVYLGHVDKSNDENDDICLQILAFLDAKYNRKKENYTIGAVINSGQDVKFAYDLDYVDLVIESDKCRNVALSLLDKNNRVAQVEEKLFEVGNRVGAVLAYQVVGMEQRTVQEVYNMCLENNMILVGYITREGGLIDVSINPNKNDKVCFDDDDLLLIIK